MGRCDVGRQTAATRFGMDYDVYIQEDSQEGRQDIRHTILVFRGAGEKKKKDWK